MKTTIGKFSGVVAIGAMTLLTAMNAEALPSFARKEGVNCMTCHTAIPQVNRVGFEYRAAGYRMPDKIGVDQTPKVAGDMNNFRASVSATSTNINGTTANTKNAVQALSATSIALHPLTGSFGTNFGSEMEVSLGAKSTKGSGTATSSISVAPQMNVNHLQFLAAYGEADSHWTFRIGQMGLLPGYGSMDRQNSSALSVSPVASLAATGGWAGKSFGTDIKVAPAIEAGYTYYGTNIAIASVNGFEYDIMDKSTHTTGNGYSSLSDSDPLLNNRDTLLRFTQFIGKNNAIGGYFYKGAVSLPNTNGSTTGFTTSTYSTDTFTRAALFGTYFVTDSIALGLGYLAGTDTLSAVDSKASSTLTFITADVYGEGSAYGFRYDTGNPTSDSGYGKNQWDIYYTGFMNTGFYYKVNFTQTDVGVGTGIDHTITKKLSLSGTYTF